jgi:chitinase
MLPNITMTSQIDCAIMAFANSSLFTSTSPPVYKPFLPVADIRRRLAPNATVLLAIGGWGDTAGFSSVGTDKDAQDTYARSVASLLHTQGFDGVGKWLSELGSIHGCI